MRNPFTFGDGGSASLIGRDRAIETVVESIRNRGRLFLTGPRRFGKTTVLKAAAQELNRSSSVVIRVEAEHFSTLDLLAQRIVGDVARSLKGDPGAVNKQVRAAFSTLNPELQLSAVDGRQSLSVTLRPSAQPGGALDVLIETLRGLESLAQMLPPSVSVGLILDEFPRILSLGGKHAEAGIRAVTQTHHHVGYVFAGSDVPSMIGMMIDPKRPFYRGGANLYLGPLPRNEFEAFLGRQFRLGGFRADQEQLRLLLNLADEVPFNTVLLARSCWARMGEGRSSKGATLSRKVIEESLLQIIREYDPMYTQIWAALTPFQQMTLLAVVRQRGVNLQSIRTAHAIGTGPATIRRALQSMIAREILREELKMDERRLRFIDPFFAHWIELFVEGPMSRFAGIP